jgi:Methyltransferase domain
LPKLVSEGQQIDLVYIDGSHLFEDVFVDFYFVSRLLSDGGVLLFDDCSDPHVRKILRFIQTNCMKSLVPYDLSAYRMDQGKSMRYMLGGLIGRRQLLAFQKIGHPERAWDSVFVDF